MSRLLLVHSLLLSANLVLESSGCASAPAARPSTPLHPAERGPTKVVLESSADAEATRVRAVLAPMERAVSECRPGEGGVIRLRLVNVRGSTQIHVEPSDTIAPRTRSCVLDALATIDVDGILNDPGTSVRPSGFTAIVRIDW